MKPRSLLKLVACLIFTLAALSAFGQAQSADTKGTETTMPYKWIRITGNAAFAPRDGAGAVVHKGKMWLLGGWNPRDKTHFPLICNNEVWSSTDGVI